MILPLALLIQAAPALAVVPANVQLGCTMALPGAAPVAFSVDLKTAKPGTAALVAPVDGPFGRVSASSDAVTWPTDVRGAASFTFATGAGQYRLDLLFEGDLVTGNARARIVGVGAGAGQPIVAQGYCSARPGKRLSVKGIARMPFDPSPRPPSPSTLQPLPAGLQTGDCRLVAPDRAVHRLGYAVQSANGNEATVAYTFGDPAWLGMATAAGTGVQFHLASPDAHLVIRTVRLETQPPLVVRTSFERSGTWIDVTRGGAVVAQGECGFAVPAIIAPPQGK